MKRRYLLVLSNGIAREIKRNLMRISLEGKTVTSASEGVRKRG